MSPEAAGTPATCPWAGTRPCRVIGVTGRPGAGKTTAAHFLKTKLTAEYFSADTAVHDLFRQPGMQRRLVDLFGPAAVRGGAVNRPYLARRCFADRQALLLLEGLLHPEVIGLTWRKIFSCRRLGLNLVLEIPLLFESGLQSLCDFIILVRGDRETRYHRKRNALSREDFTAREQRLLHDNYKIDKSHANVVNNEDIPALWRELERVIDGRCFQT